jgi:cation diffusion facilitator CzcD-associated flavoprotein CzcO
MTSNDSVTDPPSVTAADGETSSAIDIVIVGAGIAGIYQLYRARVDGFSAVVIEAGEGVGGTWYWNRYPGARSDSEIYSYAYLFSKELFEEWRWPEHFAGQPEVERYLNHVVDRFDLRRHIRLGITVSAAEYDEASNTWTVRGNDGTVLRTRFLVAATGVLSVPFFPDVPGRESFVGESYHTGLWPARPVSFAGRRVAVIGTGASGVQLIPHIVDAAAAVTVYQRTPNWCTPLNNGPIRPDERADLHAGFEAMRALLDEAPTGFIHPAHDRATFDEAKRDRWAFYERLWHSRGFAKLFSNYTDLLTDGRANAEFCSFIAEKIRGIVTDPRTAERLIPNDHGYSGKRPPFVKDYYEVYNDPRVSLVDLRETPIVRVVPAGIETSDGLGEFDVIVWATGFDFGTGALLRMDIRGRGGATLADHWADGPRTFLGIQAARFPNFFFPDGPHGAAGNVPRYLGDQVDYVGDLLVFMRDHGFRVAEVSAEAEEEWTDLMNDKAGENAFVEASYFYGANIPGKPRRYLLNSLGRPKMLEMIAAAADSDYKDQLA